MKIENTNKNFFFENKETRIVLKSKTQQFCRNKTRAMYANENYYENFFEILMNKLIKMQIENLVMQRVRIQLKLKNQRKICVEKN